MSTVAQAICVTTSCSVLPAMVQMNVFQCCTLFSKFAKPQFGASAITLIIATRTTESDVRGRGQVNVGSSTCTRSNLIHCLLIKAAYARQEAATRGCCLCDSTRHLVPLLTPARALASWDLPEADVCCWYGDRLDKPSRFRTATAFRLAVSPFASYPRPHRPRLRYLRRHRHQNNRRQSRYRPLPHE
jgi:hypothetical protein